MFKFRRPSICSSNSDIDILTDSDSATDVVDEIELDKKGDSINSLSESRPVHRYAEKESDDSIPDSVSISADDPLGCLPTITKSNQSPNPATVHSNSAMCDRKRKERHESNSQGQEKKVTRSLSQDEPKGEEEKGVDFRRTRSNDNFMNRQEFAENDESPNAETDWLDSSFNTQTNSNMPASVETDSFSVVVLEAQPQCGMMRNMPTNFEPELQRQLERSAQWTSSRKVRKSHRFRHSKSSKSQPALEIEIEANNDDTCDLNSPSSSESSSTESLADMDAETKPVSPTALENSVDACGPVIQVLEPLPSLDFSTLHHQVESNEPISFMAALNGSGLEDQVMLSPRNCVLIKEAVDSSFPPSPPLYQAQMDPPISRQNFLGGNPTMKMNTLARQISNMKRQLKYLEDEHEQLFGYKPSHADKLNHKEMKKCLLQLTKAKRELKQMREDPSSIQTGNHFSGDNLLCVNAAYGTNNSSVTLSSLEDTVKEIEKNLAEKRNVQNRPEDPGLMTQRELIEEKSSMQRQLLMLEKRHGRPNSKQEKDIVRSVYDRYRSIKKISSRITTLKENTADLVPIMEHETLEFAATEGESNISVAIVEVKKSHGSPKGRRRRLELSDVKDEEGSNNISVINEGFNEMNLSELEVRQKTAKEEKRRLRSLLRRFESDFQTATGRPPLKEEKHSSSEMEMIYQKYKRIRATVRLLEVLITKRKYPQLLVDLNKNED